VGEHVSFEGEHTSFASGCVEILPLLGELVVCVICDLFLATLSSYLFLRSHGFFYAMVLSVMPLLED